MCARACVKCTYECLHDARAQLHTYAYLCLRLFIHRLRGIYMLLQSALACALDDASAEVVALALALCEKLLPVEVEVEMQRKGLAVSRDYCDGDSPLGGGRKGRDR